MGSVEFPFKLHYIGTLKCTHLRTSSFFSEKAFLEKSSNQLRRCTFCSIESSNKSDWITMLEQDPSMPQDISFIDIHVSLFAAITRALAATSFLMTIVFTSSPPYNDILNLWKACKNLCFVTLRLELLDQFMQVHFRKKFVLPTRTSYRHLWTWEDPENWGSLIFPLRSFQSEHYSKDPSSGSS